MKLKMIRAISAFMLPAILASCCSPKERQTAGGTEESPVLEQGKFVAYTTTADRMKLFVAESGDLGAASSMSPYRVTVDPSSTYQTIDGFGAAITGATCYNLLKMTESDRQAFLREIFDPKEGLGVSLIRVSIGSSDFGLDEYTWCDTPGIENFAVHPLDKRDVLPVLKEIYKINPKVKVIASPWSAPRWMKRRSVDDGSDFYSWTSGSLKPSCYEDYATYFVKWIQVMEEEGFDIEAITIQNEPLNHGNSMSMFMSWQEQRDFIRTALGPAFLKAGIDTKILLFDHNYNYDNIPDQKSYPLNILADPETAKYIAGSAWHNYGGHVSELDNIVANAPDKEIYFTEASIGTWNYSFAGCLVNDFRDIFMETLSRGNKGVTLWNLMLDENGAPNRPGGCQTCYGAVEVSSGIYKVTNRLSHYYNIAHASKVVRPGAVRVGVSGFDKAGVQYLVFRNPDNSYGALVLNENSDTQRIVFVTPDNSVMYDVPGKAIVSVAWNK